MFIVLFTPVAQMVINKVYPVGGNNTTLKGIWSSSRSKNVVHLLMDKSTNLKGN